MVFRIVFLIFLSFTPIFSSGTAIEQDQTNGWTALHHAIFERDLNKVKELIQQDPNYVKTHSFAGIYPIHMAVKVRELPIIEHLLKNGADIDSQDGKGQTPLHYAISMKRLEFVKFLALKGADLDLPNDFGVTPVHQASFSGNFDIVKFLVTVGVDTKAKTESGATPLDFAIHKNHSDIANYLMFHNH